MGGVGRPRPALTVALAAIFFFLLLAYLVRLGLTLDWLRRNKDAISAAGTLVSAGAVLTAGTLAYYRYFKGRVFSTRAEISIASQVTASPDGQYLHSVEILFENIGTVTIWQPTIVLYIMARHRDGATSRAIIEDWNRPEDERSSAAVQGVVDPGETALFFTERLFPEDIWCVRYTATVSSKAGDVWTAIRTVKNQEQDRKVSQ